MDRFSIATGSQIRDSYRVIFETPAGQESHAISEMQYREMKKHCKKPQTFIEVSHTFDANGQCSCGLSETFFKYAPTIGIVIPPHDVKAICPSCGMPMDKELKLCGPCWYVINKKSSKLVLNPLIRT